MRALFKLITLLLLLCLLAIPVAAYLALSGQPLVSQQFSLSHQDIARAKALLRGHDPRRLPPGAKRTIEISAADLDLAANYLIRHIANGKAHVQLDRDRLLVQATLEIPQLPLRRFLNIDAALAAPQGTPETLHLQIGRLRFPGALADLLAQRLFAAVYDQAQRDSAARLLSSLELFADRLRLSYEWDPALLEQARDTLLSQHDREALGYYLDLLVAVQQQGVGNSGSLTDLLEMMFAAALQRSQTRDPVTENTALLTVLGAWAIGHNAARLVPGSDSRPRSFRLKLRGRRDVAQHLLVSAAMAARADSMLSDAVGLFKEIHDGEHGSGFSFTDIAADRSGTRFGELATASPEQALAVQRRLAAGISEEAIMPPLQDLPEHLSTERFKQRFGHVGSPAYQQLMDEIERRIDASELFRI